MARTYEATVEITHPDEDHILPTDYKDNTGLDAKISLPNFIKTLPLKNDIINGNFDVWQRFNTTKAALANGDYLADRWAYEKAGTLAVHTCNKETTIIPDGASSTLNLQVTTLAASIAAGDYILFTQIIEGYNIQKYIRDGFLTLGFWIRSPKAGTFCVSIRNNGKDRSYIKEIIIAAANTLEYHTVTIPMNFTGGTWDYTNGAGIRISFALAAGTTYQTTADAWQTGNFFATSNQQNLVDALPNNFYIGLVTCNTGKLPVLNSDYDIIKTIEECQRFYEKSYGINVNPGTVTSNGAVVSRQADTSIFVMMQKMFVTRKRANPTMVWYSNNSGSINNIYSNSAPTGDYSVTGTQFSGETSFGVPTTSPASPDMAIMSGHFTADAEISV